MANLHSFFIFSLIFLPYSMSSSPDYTFPQQYFINCGSHSSVSVSGTTHTIFSSDTKSDSRHSRSVNDPALSGIYGTARVFSKSSLYELSTEENGVYMVRLHFFPFSNLFDAKFDVLASDFSILSNYSVPKNVTYPVIKEFLLPVNGPNLKIYFRPSHESSFAFVNAIEAYVTPQDFIPESASYVTPQGNSNNAKKDLSLSALAVIQRINVGGPKITPENDTMRRNWVPDDDYLSIKRSAKNHPSANSARPIYEGGATEYDAPPFVYKTAKEMNRDDVTQSNNSFNITWLLRVKRYAAFFVRLHFCDIVSKRRNSTVFNAYIYGLFGQPIVQSPPELRTPFYVDFVVDSDGSGFMNISVVPLRDSVDKNAFLNGVEIMELINKRESVPEGNGKAKNRLLIIIGSTVGCVVLAFVSVVVILFCLKSRKPKRAESVDGLMVNVYAGSSTIGSSSNPEMSLGLKIPFAEILYATHNFDPKFMIGEGGFGKVYKGTLHNGVKVAVKRSEPGNGQGIMEFQTEITLLSKIRHQHLVSLIGYCDERNEMILVYEFMEKGTLREHLYSSKEDVSKSCSRSELSWDQRLQICIGAAKGLHYLHTGLSEPIIHRDIKSSKSTNILLDEFYVAKVADFGLSKSGPIDQTHMVTDVKGSFGYLDPEYVNTMQLTQKSDVYSFGVVLLEVLSARPAVDNLLPRNQMNLAEWGLSWIKKKQLEKIIDPLLAGKINPTSLRKFGETAEKCVQEDGSDRPSMADVLWDLNYALSLQHPGKPQEFHEDSNNTDVSWQMALPGIHRLPSIDVSTSCVSASESEVFSQLKIDEAR
ncbi:probable receptor-like protein kinase At5g24010 [Lycium barbarum]|uniref:probable receptor-like protein kinase At5g24010 n=1 Tax=Lycium barbarum TaxID=112863 RepID=UPI00293E4A77|nr:probable receptor-like protein kinase At5g24010 [Lycium barbarum]